MAKKSTRKSATPGPKAAQTTPGKPGASAPKPGSKGSRPLEMSPIARHVLENARKRSPLDAAAGAKKLSEREVDAIRQLAIALAENELGTDEDLVMICNRITEPPAVPLADLRYDICRWCEAEIYYDRLMPSPPGLMRVCLTCGILLIEAEKKGKN